MAFAFYRIIGPFRTTIPDADGWPRFGFICHRTDDVIVHYTLTFNPDTRMFSAQPSAPTVYRNRAAQRIAATTPEGPTDPQMFFPGPPPIPLTDKVTDLLREMLTDEDIAACTAAAVKVKRIGNPHGR